MVNLLMITLFSQFNFLFQTWCIPFFLKDFESKKRILQKKYWALVIGCPRRSGGIISAPLGKVRRLILFLANLGNSMWKDVFMNLTKTVHQSTMFQSQISWNWLYELSIFILVYLSKFIPILNNFSRIILGDPIINWKMGKWERCNFYLFFWNVIEAWVYSRYTKQPCNWWLGYLYQERCL